MERGGGGIEPLLGNFAISGTPSSAREGEEEGVVSGIRFDSEDRTIRLEAILTAGAGAGVIVSDHAI